MADRTCKLLFLAACLLAGRTAAAASESAEALRMRGRSPPAPRYGSSGEFNGGESGSFVGTLGGTSGSSRSSGGMGGGEGSSLGGGSGSSLSGGFGSSSRGNIMTTQGGSFGSASTTGSALSTGTRSGTLGGGSSLSGGSSESSTSSSRLGGSASSDRDSMAEPRTTTTLGGAYQSGTLSKNGGQSSTSASSSDSSQPRTTATLGGSFSGSGGEPTAVRASPSSPGAGSTGKAETLGGSFSGSGGQPTAVRASPSSPGAGSTGKAETASPSPPATPTTPGGVSTVSGGTSSAASGAACGLTGSASCAGANSDPVMYGFAGRSFNFIGDPGKIYSIISTQNLQVSMKLKLAQMWDHNGTNMVTIGFMYRDYKVLIDLEGSEQDILTVTLQGKKLKEKKSAQHHAWRFEDGAYIETTWDRFKAGLGNTVVVQTDVLKMTIWETPAGIVDEGGVVLPAWLNFGITLLGPPANGIMHGIVGGTYDRYLEGESAVSKPESQLYLPPDDAFHGIYDQQDYEMADFWDTNFKANLFGAQPPAIKDRSSLETDAPIEAAFPAFARACFMCAATPSGQGHAY